jgi:predicted nucleotidyltransferase
MGRAEIIATLQGKASEIRQFGATSLYLFGSVARDEATEASDVDLFINYDPDRFTFVELVQLRRRLSDILGLSADLTTRGGLHPLLRSGIEAEAIKVV